MFVSTDIVTPLSVLETLRRLDISALVGSLLPFELNDEEEAEDDVETSDSRRFLFPL